MCNGFLGLQDAKTKCDKWIIIESQKFWQFSVLSFFVKNKFWWFTFLRFLCTYISFCTNYGLGVKSLESIDPFCWYQGHLSAGKFFWAQYGQLADVAPPDLIQERSRRHSTAVKSDFQESAVKRRRSGHEQVGWEIWLTISRKSYVQQSWTTSKSGEDGRAAGAWGGAGRVEQEGEGFGRPCRTCHEGD